MKLSDIAAMDAVFIQRPFDQEHMNLMHMAHSMGVKVWLDYDDNLFCVPKENQAHKTYASDATRKMMMELLRKADAISVSTEQLGKDYCSYINDGAKIYVIPNALNDYLFRETPKFKPHKNVFWRGSVTHQQDMFLFGPKIHEVAQKHRSWLFTFLGYDPFFLTQRLGKQGAHQGFTDCITFQSALKLMYPNVGYVTLTESPFNLCKSNIAWLEATYAGAVTLAPEWPEWIKPGVVTYKDQHSFASGLDQLLSTSESDLARYHEYSWNYINDHLRLSQVNAARVKLLKEMVGLK